MSITDYPNLLETLQKEKKIIYVFGAGMSMAMGCHNLTWSAWLCSGEKYLTADEKDIFCRNLSDGADGLMKAAGFLFSALKDGGYYDGYMQESFGKLNPVQQELTAAVRLMARTGDVLTTTNYDQLIEKATNLSSVTYSVPGEILNIIRGEGEQKVIHLHGLYDSGHGVDDIIADGKQYESILTNEGAQFIQNLIGTYPVIFVGCGATIEDPNLSGFISFASEHLNLDVPYYYICKEGDALPGMPSNVAPIFYGSEYSDMPQFVNELASYRIKYRADCKEIVRINPYAPKTVTPATYARLHFTSSFHKFVGREKEQKRLDSFLHNNAQISWWVVTGEGGIGKSRLLLEWMRSLPVQWFGFFIKTGCAKDAYRCFQPFSDTVVVLDYVMGQETACAQIVHIFMESFEKTDYQLRFVFLERRMELDAQNGWFTNLLHEMDSVDAICFQDKVYQENSRQKELVRPLKVPCLTVADKQTYIQEYAKAYCETFPEETEELNIDDIIDVIERDFCTQLDKKYDRPLFLSIYIEVWICKKGVFSLNDIDDLLGLYLEREEKRWLLALENDKFALNDYLSILAFASAIELACINSGDNGYLQPASERIYQKFYQAKKPGKKKLSWAELFIWEEKPNTKSSGMDIVEQILDSDKWEADFKFGVVMSYMKMVAGSETEDDQPESYLLIAPGYPDIIREFIVDYYIPEEDIVRFAQAARNQSTLEFGNFLNRALEDFPGKSSFAKMAITPPESDTDRFEYYTTLLIRVRELINYRELMEQDLIPLHQGVEGLAGFEMELWRRIVVVLGTNVSQLEASSRNFLLYLQNRVTDELVFCSLPDVLHAYIVGFYNGEGREQLECFLDSIVESTNFCDDEGVAIECAEGYFKLSELKELFDQSRRIRQDTEKLFAVAEKFPKDYDIIWNLSEVCQKYIASINGRNMAGRMTKTNRRLLVCFEQMDLNNAEEQDLIHIIAGNIAVCLANEYYNYSQRENVQEDGFLQMQFCKSKIGELYEAYGNEKNVIMAYASLWVDLLYRHAGPVDITDEQVNLFKQWYEQYPEDIEFSENYAQILALRHEYYQRNGCDRKAQDCVRKLEQIAQKVNYGEYCEEENQIETILQMIKMGLL